MSVRIRSVPFVVLALMSARPAAAQVLPVSLDSVRALGLDSVSGAATAYFRPADRERALELRTLLDRFLAFYQERAGVESRMRVAVLDPTDWARLSRAPYGLPNNSRAPDNVLLAATSPPARIGARAMPAGRLMDFLVIGHEGGHLLVWELMPPEMKAEPPSSVGYSPEIMKRYRTVQTVPGWYWEFAANYLMVAFLEANHPEDAAAWRAFLAEIAGVPAPRFTHLADWYGAVLWAATPDSTPYVLSDEGGLNQSWYQGVTGLAADHVYSRSGLALIPHIRRMVSGEEAPKTQSIVEELEAMAPGLIELLERLGAGYIDAREPRSPESGRGP